MPIATLVTIAGEVDIATCPELRGHLETLPYRSTVVQMSEVELLFAAGLTVLLDLRGRFARAGARVVLPDPGSDVSLPSPSWTQPSWRFRPSKTQSS
jgi:anti-anti-sigma regulatory factor